MISVQFTIAGAPYENIKVRIEAHDSADLAKQLDQYEGNAYHLFRYYEHLTATRDAGHQEAVQAIVEGLGATVEVETSTPQPEAADKPFWDAEQPVQADASSTPAKPWDRKKSNAEPAAPAAGQTISLL
jgi:hypothetical protein